MEYKSWQVGPKWDIEKKKVMLSYGSRNELAQLGQWFFFILTIVSQHSSDPFQFDFYSLVWLVFLCIPAVHADVSTCNTSPLDSPYLRSKPSSCFFWNLPRSSPRVSHDPILVPTNTLLTWKDFKKFIENRIKEYLFSGTKKKKKKSMCNLFFMKKLIGNACYEKNYSWILKHFCTEINLLTPFNSTNFLSSLVLQESEPTLKMHLSSFTYHLSMTCVPMKNKTSASLSCLSFSHFLD